MVKITSYLLISLSASLLALSGSVEAKPTLGACFLKVPKNPLTAKGLASPYILKKGNCDQTIADQQVFVEATVFDIDTNTFSVYHPLVINEGKGGKSESEGDWFRNCRNVLSLSGMNPVRAQYLRAGGVCWTLFLKES